MQTFVLIPQCQDFNPAQLNDHRSHGEVSITAKVARISTQLKKIIPLPGHSLNLISITNVTCEMISSHGGLSTDCASLSRPQDP